MSLTPIACSSSSIVVNPPLIWPPTFLFGFGYVNTFVSVPVTFDFTPLRDIGLTALVRYFSYTIESNAHDWAEAGDALMAASTPGRTFIWGGAQFLHSPPPTYSGYYVPGAGTVTQQFDEQVKPPFDTAPSPAFGPFDRFFAQDVLGATDNGIPVMGPCALLTASFQLNLEFSYSHSNRSTLAYATHDTAPAVTITNLTAWCEVFDEWSCTSDCGGATSIASGHTEDVCLRSEWVRDSDLPNGGSGGLVAPPGMSAPITVGSPSTDTCTVPVTIGCLTAEQIAAHHFEGPYRYAFITAVHCTFSGVAYTRVLWADFSVTADEICTETEGITGEPFNLQDHAGRYHATGTNSDGIIYLRSDFGTNAALGWAVTSQINNPGGKTLHNPRVIVDDRQEVRLVYSQHDTSGDTWDGVYQAVSHDDGETWEAGTLLIADGKHPTVAIGQDGAFQIAVVAAYVGPDDGPGVITARVQGAGDADFGDPFNFKDDADTDLSVADDTFHIQQARDDQSRWMLHVRIDGDSSTSQWTSYDETATWQRVV